MQWRSTSVVSGWGRHWGASVMHPGSRHHSLALQTLSLLCTVSHTSTVPRMTISSWYFRDKQRVNINKALSCNNTHRFNGRLPRILRHDSQLSTSFPFSVLSIIPGKAKYPWYHTTRCTAVYLRDESFHAIDYTSTEYCLTTVGRRAFAVQGPMVWNSLPDDLCAQQDYWVL